MKHLLVLSVFVCVVAFVAAQETSEEEVAKLSAAEVSPIRVPAVSCLFIYFSYIKDDQ